ncbi:Yip1 family protein [Salinimonas chungwhensis]|uniref:Yip1 family protein n=1 Tax=Salinimonas chungwhensis TaxID=265425 RepID=UPI000370A7A2|nr:Yip1 family protein [Salinimonas chungwhensis]
MQTVSNPIQACNNIFFKPRGVFQALAHKNNWSWIPFILIVAAAMVTNYLYFSMVDFEWFVERTIAGMGDVSPAEIEQARSMQKLQFYKISALVGPVIAMPLFNAIVALYLHLTTKSDEKNVQGYTDWYGMTWWIMMPMLVTSLVALILMALADNHQISLNILQPLSLAYVLSVDMNSPWLSLAQAASPITLWTIYLAIVGITQWTSFSSKTAAVIAIAPYAIIYGIWAITLLLM